MHIAVFTAFYPPHLGGVERYSYNLASELAALGHTIYVITSADRKARDLGQKYAIVEIPSKTIMDDRFPIIQPNKHFAELTRQMKMWQLDAVIINTRYYPLCLFACYIAEIHGLRPIIIDHSSGYLSSDNTPLGFVMRCYERFMTKRIKHARPFFYSVSRRSAEWLKTFNIDVRGILPNSIDVEAYCTLASAKEWRKDLSVGSSKLITYAGRLIPQKGVLRLIAAVEELREEGDDVHLAIAGSGPLLPTLQKKAKNGIHVLGPLASSDLSALLHQTDIFCLPTDYPEGLPTVLLEAAAQKAAIIVSNTGGAEEIVPLEYNGIILHDTGVASIKNAILLYLNDDDRLQLAQESAYRHVKSTFSWRSTALRLIAAIQRSKSFEQ